MGNGSETWYRGEGAGVARARPEGVPMDFGDGYYVADSFEAAKGYAGLRTSNPADQRLFSVGIDRSSLRILDLTTNPAWQKHVKPVEPLIRQANENYGRTFQNFIKANNIDLTQYDAVIGPDYTYGGRQMCILLKNGKPSPFEVSVRARLQPLTPATSRARAQMPPIDVEEMPVRVVSPQSEFIGTAAEVAITIGVAVILSLLETWDMERTAKRKIEKELKELAPKISDRIDKLKPEIAKAQLLLDPGEKVFANITVQIHWMPRTLGAGRGDYIDPEVRLAYINITTRNLKSERHFKQTLREGSVPDVERSVDEYTYSNEVEVYTKEQLDLFNEWSSEYLQYNLKRLRDPTNQMIIAEMRRLRERITRAFGSDIWYLEILPFGA